MNNYTKFYLHYKKIPPKAARALHVICDTHSPIAEDVVIFLTLTIAPNKEGKLVFFNIEIILF